MESTYHDLDKIKLLAEHYSKEHKCAYTVIKMDSGTFEFVTDSYFESHKEGYEFVERFEYKGKTLNEIIDETNTIPYTNPYKDQYLDLSNISRFHDFQTFEKHPPYIRETPKIGRNKRCTCGCEKKVKKCPNK